MCASAIAGCITSILCGMFLDKYKCFNELIKGLYLMAACVAVSLCLVSVVMFCIVINQPENTCSVTLF